MFALYKVCTGERAWKTIWDWLQASSYLGTVDHYCKPRTRKQRRNIRKYSFVNRSITDWNKLPEVAIRASHGKTHIFKTKVREAKTSERK
jgi:hypothetical protein